MSTATAGMPLPVLLHKLAHVGGGGLARRHRVVLDGLARILPHRSATGTTTVGQLADVTGYSDRWVRETLHELEDAGIVRWQRGGVIDGRPTPSVISIVKRLIIELLLPGRARIAKARAGRLKATLARIAGFRRLHSRRPAHPGHYLRRSAHAEVAGNPTPPGGGDGAPEEAARRPTLTHPSHDVVTEVIERRATGTPTPPERVHALAAALRATAAEAGRRYR